MTQAPPSPGQIAEPNPLLKLAVDFGPLLVFFAVNTLTGGLAIVRMLTATAAFMVATGVAMAISRWKLGHISPMLWISGSLVMVFGALTLWTHDGTFLKMKPTLVYLLFASVLTYGLIARRPLLQSLLGSSYPGLTALGWRKLTLNWTFFFVGMAVLNEAVWRTTAPLPDSDMAFWAGFKLWGAMPLTLLFALANIPMLLRHGLTTDPQKMVADAPPEG